MHDGILEPWIHAPVCPITFHSVVTVNRIPWWAQRAVSDRKVGREWPLPGLRCVWVRFFPPTTTTLPVGALKPGCEPPRCPWERVSGPGNDLQSLPCPEMAIFPLPREATTAEGVAQGWFAYWEGETSFLPSSFLGKYLSNKQIVICISCKHVCLYFLSV